MIARYRLGPLVLRYTALIFFTIVVAIPFLNMVVTSVTDEKEVYLNPGRLVWIPKPIRLDNFARAMTFPNIDFVRAFRNTMFIIVVNMTTFILSSSWVAYGFARVRFKGRRILFIFMLSTMMIPYQVRLIPLYIFFSRLGWVNTFMPIIIFGFFGAPFYIFLFRQFIKNIPADLFDAAKIDGCSHYRIFWQITLPQLTPVVTAIAVFRFIGDWQALMGPLIYLKKHELFTIALELSRFQGIATLPQLAGVPLMNLLMAASLITMIPPTIIFIVGQKYFMRSLDISAGLKG